MTANEPPKSTLKLTPQEKILKKVIAKAVTNGWQKDGLAIVFSLYDTTELLQHNRYYQIVFDHGFAKSLWGKETWQERFANGDKQPTLDWREHLMQLAIAANPLDYLNENI